MQCHARQDIPRQCKGNSIQFKARQGKVMKGKAKQCKVGQSSGSNRYEGRKKERYK